MLVKCCIEVVIFDMDGLLIDLELFWDQVEVEVMESLGVDICCCDELFDLFGL